jgi:hypothetical protein
VRISERKRQLREQGLSEHREDAGGSEPTPRAAKVQRARPTAVKATPRQAGKTGTSKAGTSSGQTRTRPVRKQRGPRFYAGFGAVGLLFSLTLMWSTYSSYNTNHKAYPAAEATYIAQTHAYPTALAKFKAAQAKHVKPAPKAPAVPKAPSNPTLSLSSFALPILYVLLSVAYLYLAYRASRQAKSADGMPRASPARK